MIGRSGFLSRACCTIWPADQNRVAAESGLDQGRGALVLFIRAFGFRPARQKFEQGGIEQDGQD
jgi:hypothetical protein